MKNQFVPFEIAKELKDLEFDEPCLAYYHDRVSPQFCRDLDCGKTVINSISRQILYDSDCTAPLWQQVIEWFREKHKIDISCFIKRTVNGDTIAIYEFEIYFFTEHYDKKYYNTSLDYKSNSDYFKYNEAREAAILKVIEIIKK
jgi:hypothetical protein